MNVANHLKTKVVATNDSTHLPEANYYDFNYTRSNLSESKIIARKVVKLGINSFPGDLMCHTIFPPPQLKLKLVFLLRI
jgi:S-ribosylhomocysteine lyase LuxS involved in autoinducer biosynthesis